MTVGADTGACKMCNSGFFAQVDMTQTGWALQYKCKIGNHGINYCKYPARYRAADYSTVRFCSACSELYWGLNYDGYAGASTACSKTNTSCDTAGANCSSAAVSNCDYFGLSGWKVNSCYQCKTGFALNNAGTACVAWTDKGCRCLDAANTACGQCKATTYFSGATCTKSNLMTIAASLLFILIAVFYN